jgi:RNA polymerase sigma-70 factor (ECF subfamily)
MLVFLLIIADESYKNKITQLYKKYSHDMLKFAASRFREAGRTDYKALAEDTVQTAFMNVIRYHDKMDEITEESEQRLYLFCVLENECNKFFRDEEDVLLYDMDELESNERDILETTDIKERYNTVVEAIEKMDYRYSVTLMLKYVNEFSVKKIACVLGLSPKTVYSRLLRGTRILKSMLREENFYD